MTREANIAHSDRYCVFQTANHWYAFPALDIRRVVPRPAVSRVPFCDPTLKGVAHLQNEFVPVLSLRSLMDAQHDLSRDQEPQLMVLSGSQGPWGLLIDRAVALAPLELSIASVDQITGPGSRVVLGSASYGNHVLQVLDAEAVCEYAAELLHGFWQSTA